MANELSGSFSTHGGGSAESNTTQILLDVMLRFYPQIKLVRLLGIFEVKLGYDILVADVYIPRNMGSEDRIRLFVCQADSTETSSCIISPQQVNFLVNGKGVERRTNISQDAGPQFPTDITKMLKYGMNLFQAVGSASGKYIIAIGVVNLVKPSGIPELQDYTPPVIRDNTLDSEIIEGPSRISLNCPISFKRIKTPVKGHLCNHHQCFDYENYMDLNSRKPTWRCPHCNQSVTYVDIRIDRYMLKILEEADEGVSDVIISADGSWKIVEIQQPTSTQSQTRSPMDHQSSNAVILPEGLLSSSPDIVDLTTEDYEDDNTQVPAKRPPEGVDRKSVHGTTVSTWQPPVMGPRAVSQISNTTVGDMPRISSGLAPNLSTSHDARRNVQINANLDSAGANLANPISSAGVYPVLKSGISAGSVMWPSTTSAQCPSQAGQTRESLRLMHQYENSVVNNEFGRPRLPLNHVPATNQPSSTLAHLRAQQKRARIGGSNFQSPSLVPTHRILDPSASSMSLSAATQGLGSQKLPGARPTSDQEHIASSIPQPLLEPRSDSQSLNIRSANLQPHQTMSQIANMLPRAYHPMAAARLPSPTNTGPVAGNVTNQQGGLLATRRGPQMPTLQTGQTALQTSRPQSTQPITDGLRNTGELVDNLQATGSTPLRSDGSTGVPRMPSQSQQDWRPTGRMRGSLSGAAYSAALSHYASPAPPQLQTRPVAQTATTAAGTSSGTFTTMLASRTIPTSLSPATNLESKASGNSS